MAFSFSSVRHVNAMSRSGRVAVAVLPVWTIHIVCFILKQYWRPPCKDAKSCVSRGKIAAMTGI